MSCDVMLCPAMLSHVVCAGPYYGGAPPVCLEGAPDDSGFPKGPHERPQGSQVGSSIPFGCHGPHSGQLPVCLQFPDRICRSQKVTACVEHVLLHNNKLGPFQVMMSWTRAEGIFSHCMLSFESSFQAGHAAAVSNLILCRWLGLSALCLVKVKCRSSAVQVG